jgi:hypothetical protein
MVEDEVVEVNGFIYVFRIVNADITIKSGKQKIKHYYEVWYGVKPKIWE